MVATHSSSNPELPSPLESERFFPRLEMPARLVFLRHGESDANRVQKAKKSGIIKEYPKGFSKIPDREIRLSRKGVEQAAVTGPWLKAQYPEGFDIIYVSDHIRAQETAAHLCRAAGWHDVLIRIDPQLGERNWGRFTEADETLRQEIMDLRKRDPLHVPMPDGETLLEARARSRILLERASREFSKKKVLIVSHGEFIESAWSEIAHLSTHQQLEFFHSDAGNIRNCQVVEFSAENPLTSEWRGKLRWVRSSCPHEKVEGVWSEISYRRYTPAELLKEVSRYPNLDFPDEVGI